MNKELTETAEYLEDRKRIDTLAKNIQNQILQLNKQLTAIQIKDFSFLIEEPREQKMRFGPWYQRLWLWIVKNCNKLVGNE